MVHTDVVVGGLDIKHSGVIDFKDMLKLLKAFFKKYDYDIDEKIYQSNTGKDGLKNTTVVWVCDKRVDDYNKVLLKPTIFMNDYKEIYVDGVRVNDGSFKISIKVEVERDYDEKWKKSPTKKFFRAVYEKYVTNEKQDKITKEAKSIIDKLKNEINQYLGV